MHGNHSEETRRSNSTRIDLFIECKESSELNWNLELKLRAWNIELKLRATATTPSQGIYRKGKRRLDSIRNNKFIECNDSPELNWGIELKLEASPTSPGKKTMSDQDSWIQHAAINSLNAVFGQKDSTEHELKSRDNVVKNRTTCAIKEPKSVHVRCQNPSYVQRYLQKTKRRSDSIHNNKFIECNDSPELNWVIELKLEASHLLHLRARNK